MNSVHPKTIGWLAILVGVMGILAVLSLSLFFVGLFQNIPSLSFMGALNDTINALVSILSALLASLLYLLLRRLMLRRLNLIMLIGVWIGAMSVTFGSWLIVTGRSDVELSSYYFFFGNGLLGTWLGLLNQTIRQHSILPRSLTQLGLIAAALMMLGLIGLFGILLRLDGSDYSPLLLVIGVSFLGIGILYPIWCLWLGRWILSRRSESLLTS